MASETFVGLILAWARLSHPHGGQQDERSVSSITSNLPEPPVACRPAAPARWYELHRQRENWPPERCDAARPGLSGRISSKRPTGISGMTRCVNRRLVVGLTGHFAGLPRRGKSRHKETRLVPQAVHQPGPPPGAVCPRLRQTRKHRQPCPHSTACSTPGRAADRLGQRLVRSHYLPLFPPGRLRRHARPARLGPGASASCSNTGATKPRCCP
jgi:hypothetical protein